MVYIEKEALDTYSLGSWGAELRSLMWLHPYNTTALSIIVPTLLAFRTAVKTVLFYILFEEKDFNNR